MTLKSDLKEWAYAAAIRAARTFAQAALAYTGATAGADAVKVAMGIATTGVVHVDWMGAIECGITAAIISMLMSFATGLPEVGRDTGAITGVTQFTAKLDPDETNDLGRHMKGQCHGQLE